MKNIFPFIAFLSLIAYGCSENSASNDENGVEEVDVVCEVAVDEAVYEVVDSLYILPNELPSELKPFESAVLHLEHLYDPAYSVDYFMFDIVGDKEPELWVRQGNCEANYELKVFMLKDGVPVKVYESACGHTDFFIYKRKLASVTTNCGSGYITLYSGEGDKVRTRTSDFSVWNTRNKAEPGNPSFVPVLRYWEEHQNKYIPFLPVR